MLPSFRVCFYSAFLFSFCIDILLEIFFFLVDLQFGNYRDATITFYRFVVVLGLLEINYLLANSIIERFRAYYNRVEIYQTKDHFIFVKHNSKVFKDPFKN
jgi:hypothetical protein